MEPAPRETWEQLFRSQGMNKSPRYASAWSMALTKAGSTLSRAGEHREGTVTPDTVIAGLIGKEWQHDQHHSQSPASA